MIIPNNILNLMKPEDRASLGKAGLLPADCRAIAVAKSEKDLQGQILGLLLRSGVSYPIRQRMDRKSNLAIGCPDILFVVHGIPVAWEVKMPGEQPRAEQVKAMAEMSADGWRCSVVRSYDEARSILQSLRHEDNDE